MSPRRFVGISNYNHSNKWGGFFTIHVFIKKNAEKTLFFVLALDLRSKRSTLVIMKNEIKLNDLVIVTRGEYCDAVCSVSSIDGNMATVYDSCERDEIRVALSDLALYEDYGML